MNTVQAVILWVDDGWRVYFLILTLAVLTLYLVFLWEGLKERRFPAK